MQPRFQYSSALLSFSLTIFVGLVTQSCGQATSSANNQGVVLDGPISTTTNDNVSAVEDISVVTDVDSDGDGLSDSFEATLGTNPQSDDSDGDGLRDMLEVDSADCDPLLVDTDGNSVPDRDDYNLAGQCTNTDFDRDSYVFPYDCNDANANIFPDPNGQFITDVLGDGIDQNCQPDVLTCEAKIAYSSAVYSVTATIIPDPDEAYWLTNPTIDIDIKRTGNIALLFAYEMVGNFIYANFPQSHSECGPILLDTGWTAEDEYVDSVAFDDISLCDFDSTQISSSTGIYNNYLQLVKSMDGLNIAVEAQQVVYGYNVNGDYWWNVNPISARCQLGD